MQGAGHRRAPTVINGSLALGRREAATYERNEEMVKERKEEGNKM